MSQAQTSGIANFSESNRAQNKYLKYTYVRNSNNITDCQ